MEPQKQLVVEQTPTMWLFVGQVMPLHSWRVQKWLANSSWLGGSASKHMQQFLVGPSVGQSCPHSQFGYLNTPPRVPQYLQGNELLKLSYHRHNG